MTYKQAPSSFVDLTIQLDEFQILLNNVSRTFQHMNSATTPGIKIYDDDEEDECRSVPKGCHASVEDLKKIEVSIAGQTVKASGCGGDWFMRVG